MRKIISFRLVLALLCLISVASLISSVAAQVHDVAVVKIDVNPTKIPRGDPVYIDVTVKNNGTLPESFTVYVYADGRHPPYGDEYVLAPQSVSDLPPGEETTLNFIWDTTGVPPGSFTISSYIPPVVGETNTADNFLKGPIVGGIFEPSKANSVNRVLDLSMLNIIFSLILAGMAAIGVLKLLGSVSSPRRIRSTKYSR